MNALEKMDDEELIKELITEFEKDAPIYLDALKAAIESGDQDEISKKAHKMNGLIANFGALKYHKIVIEIENSARKCAFDPNMVNSNTLEAELTELKRALRDTDWNQLCKHLTDNISE